MNAYIIDDSSSLLLGTWIHELQGVDSVSAIDSESDSGDPIDDGSDIQYFDAVEVDLKWGLWGCTPTERSIIKLNLVLPLG